MSDFFSPGWALAIGAITIISLLACLALLIIAARRRVMADDNTTGHVGDGDLREMNNPLPRWWMWLFVITVAFAFAYLYLYPGLGSHPGALKWSSSGQFDKEMGTAREKMAPLYARYAQMPAEEIARDAQAMAIGERLYANHCAGCHGADARGSKGFPNLTDKDWLWGGSLDNIKHAILEGRNGNMPAMAAALGSAEDVRNVANYVLSLSGSPHQSVAAQLGKAKFGACAACHGPEGKGNPAVGAPNLTDRIWLHGWGEQAIVNIITQGKSNVMPPQGRLLSPEQVHVLAGYVWSLSNGTETAAAR